MSPPFQVFMETRHVSQVFMLIAQILLLSTLFFASLDMNQSSMRSSAEMMKTAPVRRLLLNVGGFTYEVEAHLLQKYPDSFLAKMLNPDWKEASDSVLRIDRDGPAFKFVYDFLSFGMLPRNQHGYTLLDRSQLEAVQAEADFYQLPDLVQECEELLNTSCLGKIMETYASI